MKDRKYRNIRSIAQESKYCANGLYYCVAYDPKQDKLISEEFSGTPGSGWVEWSDGLINIGVIDHRMTMKEIRAMVEEVLREVGRA